MWIACYLLLLSFNLIIIYYKSYYRKTKMKNSEQGIEKLNELLKN